METVDIKKQKHRTIEVGTLSIYVQKILYILHIILFFLLCLLFITLGLNHMVYPTLYASGIFGLILLILLFRQYDNFSIHLLTPLIPFGLFLYTAFTPGYWFKDLPIATMMSAAYITGLAAQCLLKEKIRFFYFCLSLTLSICFVYNTTFGLPNLNTNSDKLKLLFYHSSVMALVVIWCMFYLFFNIKTFSKRLRPIVWSSLFLNLIIFMLSGARSAYIGCIAAVLFIGIYTYRKYIHYIIFFIVLISITTYIVLPEKEKNRICSLIQNPICDPTFQSRLPIWEVAVNGITISPIFGNSIRGFYEYDKNYKKIHLNEMKTRYSIIETSAVHPHNIYLGILFMSGFAGALFWLIAYIPAVRAALQQQDMFFICFLTFYLFYGLSCFSLHRKDGAITLFFPLGIVYGRHLMQFYAVSKIAAKRRPLNVTRFPSCF